MIHDRKTYFLPLLLLVGALLAAPAGRAASSSEADGQSQAKSQAPEKRAWSLSLLNRTSTSLHELDDPRKRTSTTFWLNPGIDLSKNLRLSALLILQKELSGEKETSVSTTTLTLARSGLELSRFFTLAPELEATLPGSKNLRERQSLLAGFEFTPHLEWTLKPLGLADLTGFYRLGLKRNFHEFETATTGSSNMRTELTNWLGVNYRISKPLSIHTWLIHTRGWTYRGNSTGTFLVQERISYRLNNHWSLAMAHQNGGSLLKADGRTSNIEAFNEQSSTVYGQVSYKF